MNIKELTIRNGMKTVGYVCGSCGNIFSDQSKEFAEKCCNNECDTCGTKLERNRYRCNECSEKSIEAREKKEFDNAKKIDFSIYDGVMVQSDLFGFNSFVLTDELEDRLRDFTSENRPKYVWACEAKGVPDICAMDILENELSEYHEDAISCLDVEGLQMILDKWVSEQPKDISYFRIDTVVLIDSILVALKKEDDEINNE